MDTYLLSLSPSGIDAELRSLGMDLGLDEGEDKSLEIMLEYLTDRVTLQKNFEFVQVISNVFLKAHGPELVENNATLERLAELKEAQRLIWTRMEESFHATQCFIEFLSN